MQQWPLAAGAESGSTVDRMRRLLTAALLVTVLVGTVLVLPTAASAVSGDDDQGAVFVTRYGGADRYATSLLVAEAFAANAGLSVDAVVMVSGRSWADAVVAAPIAGALGAPVLMTPPGELRDDAAAFVQRVGASSVVVVGTEGQPDTVSDEVVTALQGLGVTVERVSGSDRYATAAAAARRLSSVGDMGGLGRTAIVASGEVFADALVAGPFAARGQHPVLLSPKAGLHAEVATYLTEAEIAHVVLMGGPAALSEAVETAVTELGASVTRLAGATRYDTAVQAAQLVTGRYDDAAGQPCFATSTVGVARARVPFDSFSAAPLLGQRCAPLVLVDPAEVPADTAAFLDTARSTHAAVGLRIFGGEAAVSQAALNTFLSSEEALADGRAVEPTVLPAGTCGGSITDEPRQLVASTNAEDPAWSPDCNRLVYTQDGSLWTMNNDGTNQQQLLPDVGAHLFSAAWSPDGTQIVYVRGYQGVDHWVAHIWTVNADGTGPTQLSTGALVDASPRWSPDGELIVFDRFDDSGKQVTRMTRTGTEVEVLTTEGRWNFGPVYSPDGTELAYVANNTIVVIDADGSNPRHIITPVSNHGELSWSPDGKRIAFIRPRQGVASLAIADLTGLHEETIFESADRVLAPRWSPDGDLLAFHTIEAGGVHRVHVAGASGDPVESDAGQCRPGGTWHTTAGFPLADWAAPSTGTLRIAVIFMDFPDAQAAHSTQEEAELGLPYMEEYLETVSYGQLDVEYAVHPEWLRAEEGYSTYLGPTGITANALASDVSVYSAELADEHLDFSTVDTVLTVFPSTHFGGGNATSTIEADGVTLVTTRVNTFVRPEPVAPQRWGTVAAHEMTHSLGLLDLYPYDDSLHTRPDPPPGQVWVATEWGRMNMWSWYLAAEHDPRLLHFWEYPAGHRSADYRRHLELEEMLAWSRWQLGWLSESQVNCISEPETTVTLAPVAQPGAAVAMAAVPLNAHEMIVIESRRKLGYDAGQFYEAADTGASTTFPRLITEGVLVYTVDSWLRSGQLPLKVAGDGGNGQVAEFPVLEVGESVTLRGYTITVTADDGDTHTVVITRNS